MKITLFGSLISALLDRFAQGLRRPGEIPLIGLPSPPAPQEGPQDADEEKHSHRGPLPPGIRANGLIRVEVPLEKQQGVHLAKFSYSIDTGSSARYVGASVEPTVTQPA